MAFFDEERDRTDDLLDEEEWEDIVASDEDDDDEDEDEDEDEDDEDDEEDREDMSIGNSEGYEGHLGGPDHFGNLSPDDLDGFLFMKFELEDAEMNDVLDQKMGELGLSGKEEFWQMEASFLRRHFGGMPEDAMNQKYMQAAMNARNKQIMGMQQRAVSADPGLTEPFEGVTIETWAQAAAGMISTQDPAEQARMLAGLNMDRAKYDRANTEFQARMQRDTTGAIATIYGQAFSQAQGVAGGYGRGMVDGSAQQQGAEPISFEKYAEIAGAQAAWGETGQDVTGMLQQVFGISAVDVSNYGAYWSTKFMADTQLMMKHSDLMEKYKAKYMGGAGGGMDDDLDI